MIKFEFTLEDEDAEHMIRELSKIIIDVSSSEVNDVTFVYRDYDGKGYFREDPCGKSEYINGTRTRTAFEMFERAVTAAYASYIDILNIKDGNDPDSKP